MQITFWKIQGAGNDFVVYDNRNVSFELSDEQVRRICDRHFGVGADGVIEVRTSPRPECVAFMHYRNADGSLAEMCGNGVRCFALYLKEQGLLSEEEQAACSFVIDTLAGPKPLAYEVDEQGAFEKATVIMGEPAFAPERIPTSLVATQEIVISNSNLEAERMEPAVVQAAVSLPQGSYLVTCVNMGNPHAVVFLEDQDAQTAESFVRCPEGFDLETPGSLLEAHTGLFPQKTNVEFAAVSGANRIRMRVFERGVGETLACGTGACATAVAALIQGKADRALPVAIELSGGILEVAWLPTNLVTLTGPAQKVFEGTLSLE